MILDARNSHKGRTDPQGSGQLRSVAKVALDYNDTDLAAPDSSLISSFADATLKEAGALEGVAGALSVGLQAHQPGSPSLAKLAASNLRFASQQAATRKQVARQLGLTDCAYLIAAHGRALGVATRYRLSDSHQLPC